MTLSATLRAAVLIAFSAVAALAADVTGSWSGSMGPDAGFQITFTFKQEGAKVTGSVAGPGGEAMPITDGKLEGETLSFKISFNGMTITHAGKVTGDEMTLTSKADGGEFPGGEMKLKRAK